MKTLVWGMIFLWVFSSTPSFGQTPPKLYDRPVFVSADLLSSQCETWKNILYPGGKYLSDKGETSASFQEFQDLASCNAYILGFLDTRIEIKTEYNPVPTRPSFTKKLIDVFIKYVKDRPENQDFAASTILSEAIKIISENH